MRARKESSTTRILQLLLLLFLSDSYKSHCHCHPFHSAEGNAARTEGSISPDTSPGVEPEPFLPLLASSPLMPFRNYSSVPTLSGQCRLNFSSTQTAMSKTATDCYSFLAPFLDNAICCPQFLATLIILIGQSSKYSGLLALDETQAMTCLSDVENTLQSQGTDTDLGNFCSIHPANLTEGSCPITHVNEFESIVDSARLLAACRKIDPVSECCEHVCENAILDAARKIALKGSSASDGRRDLEKLSTRIADCKNIVLRWLAGKLDPSSTNGVLRALISCDINKVCPLDLPQVTGVSKECGDHVISNNTSCCISMGFYMSSLQDLSLLTNLQAVNCAISLGKKLQKANVTQNVYNLCHIKLMDFTLQEYSGCLLPSLPSDATYDNSSGLGITCDLSDNVEAPWPFNSSSPSASSCHESTKIPALPSTTSAQDGMDFNLL
ncbi:putative GPI-anchored protein [Tripterygium wilfordii]|uniref:Putative GPI-anchored protein n=1 Tax=Tripterygium wilfordii TaxID=458696 RepID=A0A7J7BXU9_TRIWF|nr:putative GPI-anchored protein [Tripterygium wilfordii]